MDKHVKEQSSSPSDTNAPDLDPPKSAADVDQQLMRDLAALMEETGLTEIDLGGEGWHMRLSRAASAAAPAVIAAVAPVAAAAAESDGPDSAPELNHPGVVTSPMVGVVYTAPEPGSPDFVRVGDTVEQGDTLVLIEAMKVFNPITASKSGKVTRILVDNGIPVEFGEALLIIE